MTTTAGQSHPTVTGPGVALAGSLAAGLGAGAHRTTLLFPGIDAAWPRALATALVGRPELAAWVDTVVTDLDDWAQTPAVRSLGLFADGFSHLLPSSPDDPISPLAATGSVLPGGQPPDEPRVPGRAGRRGPARRPSTAADHPLRRPQRRAAGRRGGDGARARRARARPAWPPMPRGSPPSWAPTPPGTRGRCPTRPSPLPSRARRPPARPMVAISGPRTARLAAILAGVGAARADRHRRRQRPDPAHPGRRPDVAGAPARRARGPGPGRGEEARRRPAGRDAVPVRVGAAGQLRALPPPRPRGRRAGRARPDRRARTGAAAHRRPPGSPTRRPARTCPPTTPCARSSSRCWPARTTGPVPSPRASRREPSRSWSARWAPWPGRRPPTCAAAPRW